jgi:hypothetical protein
MVQATAPAFILGAVAGFISILLGRMTSVIERIRGLMKSPTTILLGPTSSLIFRACGSAPNF